MNERQVLAELRRARRRRRLGERGWGELAYRAYVTALVTVLVGSSVVGWIGDEPVAARTADRIAAEAPAWLGLGFALVVLLAVRTGSRGGPVAIEAPELHHVLLAPIDRGAVLRRAGARALVSGAGWGVALGGVAGDLTAGRLPGNDVAWIASAALAGALVGVLAAALALLVAGRRLPAAPATLGALGLVVWSVTDVAGDRALAPTAWLGRIAVWPLATDLRALAGVPVVLALAVAGWSAIPGLAVEQAQRRSALVGQLRFAVTRQDLRSVLLLRRQLADERARPRPWFPGLPAAVARRFPVLARDLQSFARWPAVRVVRVVLLAIGAGLALRGAYDGTSALVILAGLATYVAALDAVEPLTQDLDHPTRLASFPLPTGVVLFRHLAAPLLAIAAAGLVGAAVAVAVAPTVRAAELAAVVLLPGVGTAVLGAAVSVSTEEGSASTTDDLVPPEVAGPRILVRLLLPPAIAAAGGLPVVAAHRADVRGDDPVATAVTVAAMVAVGLAVVAGWFRYREELRATIAGARGGST